MIMTMNITDGDERLKLAYRANDAEVNSDDDIRWPRA